jgi:hypothetical protein
MTVIQLIDKLARPTFLIHMNNALLRNRGISPNRRAAATRIVNNAEKEIVNTVLKFASPYMRGDS